jgi:uncharacterized protein YjbJ (UPF0337 family)
MDWDRVSANWIVYGPQAQKHWSQLSNKDLEEIDGSRDKLIVYLQDIYGYGKERAEMDADDWCSALTDSATLVTSKLDAD